MIEQLTPIVFFLTIIVMVYFINYNKFIKYKNRIEASWSSIDVALKRRFNLIPNLVKTVSQYQKHESDVFKKSVGEFHEKIDNFDLRSQEEGEVTQSLGGILALVENYPDLKSNENFLALQNSLIEIEDDIMKARESFNKNVSRYNMLVESYPSKWIASLYGFSKYEYFTLELATQREMPNLNF